MRSQGEIELLTGLAVRRHAASPNPARAYWKGIGDALKWLQGEEVPSIEAHLQESGVGPQEVAQVELAEWDEKCRERGAPYCDWCGHAAVFSEIGGWHHSVAAHRFGLPRHLEAEHGIPDPGHEISTRAWAMVRYGHE